MAKSKAKQTKSGKGKIIGFAIYLTILVVLTLIFLAQIGMIGNQNNLENELKLSQYKLEYQEQLNKQQNQYYSEQFANQSTPQNNLEIEKQDARGDTENTQVNNEYDTASTDDVEQQDKPQQIEQQDRIQSQQSTQNATDKQLQKNKKE